MRKIDVSTHGNAANVAIRGSLCFKDVDAFKKVMALTDNKELDKIYMDLNELKSIDDEGIGLLMLLRIRARKNKQRISLYRAHGDVKKKIDENRIPELFSNS